MTAPVSPARGESPLYLTTPEHKDDERLPSDAAVGMVSKRFFSREDREVAALTRRDPCPEDSPTECATRNFSSPTGAPFLAIGDIISRQSWDKLRKGSSDKGSGFVRYADIEIEGETSRMWIKRPRHIGRTILASLISEKLGDESVIPAALARLADGTIVTVQPHCEELHSALDTNSPTITLENYEYALLSFVNAITLSFFDDDIYNREGLEFVTVDLEASLPLSQTLTLKVEDEYYGTMERPKLSSAIPFLFLLKGKLYEPISSEVKDSLLRRIGNPVNFTGEISREYMEANEKIGVTTSCYEIVREDGSREAKRVDLSIETELMLGGYRERLTTVKSILKTESPTPFSLLHAINPLFANILKIGSFLYKEDSILEAIGNLVGSECNLKDNIEMFERRISPKPESPEKETAVRALEELKELFVPEDPRTEDVTIFASIPTLSHRELWGEG